MSSAITPDRRTFDAIVAPIAQRLGDAGGRPLVVGLCGAQGSGKSTVAAALAAHFNALGIPTAVLSIDDLYRTQPARIALARQVHPLLRTRGVPGTHDTALGLSVFAGIDAGAAVRLPRFDKAIDDRLPVAEWDSAPAGTRLVIFEGWCVGARPQSPAELAEPINALERAEDAEGIWRRHVNAALAGAYQQLFERIDLLVLLAAPSFDAVFGWRIEQEHALRLRSGVGMSDEAVVRFVRHYERLTLHILAEMPPRADLVVRLDAARSPVSLHCARSG